MWTPSSSSCIALRTRSRSPAVDSPICTQDPHTMHRRKKLAFGLRKRPLDASDDDDDDVVVIVPDPKPPLPPPPQSKPKPNPKPEVPATPSPIPIVANSIARRTRSRCRDAIPPRGPPREPVLICIDSDDDDDNDAIAHPPPPPPPPLLLPKEEARSILSDSVSAVGCAGRGSDESVSVAAAEEDHVDAAAQGTVRVDVDEEGGGGEVEGDDGAESGPRVGSEFGSNRGSSATTATTVAVGEEVDENGERDKAAVVEAPNDAPEGPDREAEARGARDSANEVGVGVGGEGEGGEGGSASLLESNNGGGSQGTEALALSDRDPPVVYGNCIARRTRSKLWFGKELEPVDYSRFFKESDSSDEDDYLWRTTSSSGFGSSEDTFGDGSSFWAETEPSGDDNDHDDSVEEVRFSGDEGSIGTPFEMWRKRSREVSSRSWREKSSRISFEEWRKKRREQSGGTSSGKRRKRRSTDDEDEDYGGEECSSSSWSAKRGQQGDARHPESRKRKRRSRDRSWRQRRQQQPGSGAIDVDERSESMSSSSSGYESDGLLEKGNVSKKDDLFDEELRRRKGRGSYRKKKSAFKDESLHKFLDDILKKDVDLGLDGINMARGGERLPLVFSFGDDDPKPAEKTEHEKAIDDLWDEYDFALRSIDIGCYNVEKEEPQSFKELGAEFHSAMPCVQENHNFILDEEVGIICKHCHSVGLERRYVFPKFTRS